VEQIAEQRDDGRHHVQIDKIRYQRRAVRNANATREAQTWRPFLREKGREDLSAITSFLVTAGLSPLSLESAWTWT